MRVQDRRKRARRSGSAALEVALLLPVFSYVCAMTVDYSRLFYALVTLSDSARAGAMYAAANPNASSSAIQQVVLAGAGQLSPSPTVNTTSGVDASGNAYVEVTVSHDFQALAVTPGLSSEGGSSWAGLSSATALSRKVRMLRNPS